MSPKIDYEKKWKQFMSEGKAAKAGFTEEDMDPEEFALGMKIEAEHSSDPDVQRHIVLDHGCESAEGSGTYYADLKKTVEKEGADLKTRLRRMFNEHEQR